MIQDRAVDGEQCGEGSLLPPGGDGQTLLTYRWMTRPSASLLNTCLDLNPCLNQGLKPPPSWSLHLALGRVPPSNAGIQAPGAVHGSEEDDDSFLVLLYQWRWEGEETIKKASMPGREERIGGEKMEGRKK